MFYERTFLHDYAFFGHLEAVGRNNFESWMNVIHFKEFLISEQVIQLYSAYSLPKNRLWGATNKSIKSIFMNMNITGVSHLKKNQVWLWRLQRVCLGVELSLSLLNVAEEVAQTSSERLFHKIEASNAILWSVPNWQKSGWSLFLKRMKINSSV